MKSSKLFGVSPEVARAMKHTMVQEEYLAVGIALMNRVQVKEVDNYNSEEFKYRAKAIKNYEKWLEED